MIPKEIAEHLGPAYRHLTDIQADLSPVGGPLLGPFERRSDAVQAEVYWLETNWLAAP